MIALLNWHHPEIFFIRPCWIKGFTGGSRTYGTWIRLLCVQPVFLEESISKLVSLYGF